MRDKAKRQTVLNLFLDIYLAKVTLKKLPEIKKSYGVGVSTTKDVTR